MLCFSSWYVNSFHLKRRIIVWLRLRDKSCISLWEATKACEYHLAPRLHPSGVNKTWALAVKGRREGKCGWKLNFQRSTMRQTSRKSRALLQRSSFQTRSWFQCMCTEEETFRTSRCKPLSTVHYLVYLDIWLSLFSSAPAQILLSTLTNIASPVYDQSKRDTVVVPSPEPNLNVSAAINARTENP